jgi:pimeloyl-ACP methyl ester carboxylesterase
VIPALAAHREVIAVDLPGCGQSPPLDGAVSIATLTDAVADFVHSEGLDGVDTVGSSMGARVVLELARRGVCGATVALDPGGFWSTASSATSTSR